MGKTRKEMTMEQSVIKNLEYKIESKERELVKLKKQLDARKNKEAVVAAKLVKDTSSTSIPCPKCDREASMFPVGKFTVMICECGWRLRK